MGFRIIGNTAGIKLINVTDMATGEALPNKTKYLRDASAKIKDSQNYEFYIVSCCIGLSWLAITCASADRCGPSTCAGFHSVCINIISLVDGLCSSSGTLVVWRSG